MDARFIILLIMSALLLGWVIFCGIQFFRHSKDLIVDADFIGHVKCEKCGTLYDVNAAQLTESHMSKSVSTSKTQFKNGAFINRPHYRYFAKKFHCPCCGKKRYAQVLNINEINSQMLKPTLRAGVRWLIFMFVGGVLILAVSSIPMFFANRAAQQKADELRQERYEEFKERYF